MAVLSAETNMAGVSELSPAIFLSSATLTGLYPNEIENRLRQENEKKYSDCPNKGTQIPQIYTDFFNVNDRIISR